VVNTYSEGELKKIIYDYGEEKFAPVIAKKIVAQREISPIKTTKESLNNFPCFFKV
jgi:16S rRNA (cytosine1402-N4)-methyltransferase